MPLLVFQTHEIEGPRNDGLLQDAIGPCCLRAACAPDDIAAVPHNGNQDKPSKKMGPYLRSLFARYQGAFLEDLQREQYSDEEEVLSRAPDQILVVNVH